MNEQKYIFREGKQSSSCIPCGKSYSRFMESAKGDRIIDADGNEYIDYVCSWGPGILGHAHPQVIKKSWTLVKTV